MLQQTPKPNLPSTPTRIIDAVVIGAALTIAIGGFAAFALTGHGLDIAIVALFEALKAYRK